ncbi:hypothetical protein AB0M57_24210 [Streptomyces sp. NPDC051597]|uniref:hypothetical protein n=1 Tax=Streptomyces sp. NPDC051597 TaxID=3155049 RepID=UPI00342077AF
MTEGRGAAQTGDHRIPSFGMGKTAAQVVGSRACGEWRQLDTDSTIEPPGIRCVQSSPVGVGAARQDQEDGSGAVIRPARVATALGVSPSGSRRLNQTRTVLRELLLAQEARLGDDSGQPAVFLTQAMATFTGMATASIR